MEDIGIINTFLQRHPEIGGTEDWTAIETALGNEDPEVTETVCRAYARLWTEQKTEPGFSRPSDSLIAFVQKQLPGGVGDPLDYHVPAHFEPTPTS